MCPCGEPTLAKPLHVSHVLHRPMAGTEAMALQSEHTFPRHSHDHFGIGVISQGAQRSWSLLGQVEAGPGDVIIVNPGEVHDGMPLHGARSWQMVYLDPELLWQELCMERSCVDVVLKPLVKDHSLSHRLFQLFHAIHQARIETGFLEETLLQCLMHLCHHHLLTLAFPPNITPTIQRAKQYLDDDPSHQTSLGELATLCGLSRFQLLRGFAREVGMTPHAYLMQLRVREARRWLAKGNSVADAAVMSGFADQSHLTRAFSRQLGITPARYQKAILL